MDPLRLAVIIVSTRPTRVGVPIATWFGDVARAHGQFAVTDLDLREEALPMFDEPKHPRFGEYEHAHTKAWSAKIGSFDAFVFVTPEYNYSVPPSLVNAIDYLHREWAYKPAAFVSYGGISGGTRSVQMAKQIIMNMKVMPMAEGVAIPFVGSHLVDGVFNATDAHGHSAKAMLDELHKWAVTLKTMRP
jgi:NAD(P)H-dependent FMN reductase